MREQNNSDVNQPLALYLRQGNQIVEAKADDLAVARLYPEWRDKGLVTDGRRITILSKKQRYQVNEEVRIIHVMEATLPGYEIYMMGPKQILNETINSRLQGEESLLEIADPFVPEEYDGRVLDSPATDYNFDLTRYTFEEPGQYNICWQPGKWKSNTLGIEVVE
jgi:hypothetical protein